MSLFTGPRGRPRVGWRLVVFVVLVTGSYLLLDGRIWAAVPGLRAGGGLVPAAGVGVSLLAALGSTWIVARRMEGVPLTALGLPADRSAPVDAARGCLFGVALMALIVACWRSPGR